MKAFERALFAFGGLIVVVLWVGILMIQDYDNLIGFTIYLSVPAFLFVINKRPMPNHIQSGN